MEPTFPVLESEVLATGPLGKSLSISKNDISFYYSLYSFSTKVLPLTLQEKKKSEEEKPLFSYFIMPCRYLFIFACFVGGNDCPGHIG